MKFKSKQNKRTIIAIFIAFIVIAETAAYLATTPRPQEQFFQFYVVGANRLAANYYPQNNPNLRISSLVSWYVGVTNSMGNAQLVEIRLKLGNETTTTPNDTSDTPSSAPAIVAFDRFMIDNETWEFPLAWSITNATVTGGFTHILTTRINNETYEVSNWSAINGYDFRVILELWVWQTNTNAFEYGWSGNGETRTAWLEIWFNMTNPGIISPP
ncbi:MAG TPA: hypothetical protein VEI80_05715 [Candidatus Acidoferrales bacterium]|nr:hypothetical protein [Candidatus Acidoferrales bacterium]